MTTRTLWCAALSAALLAATPALAQSGPSMISKALLLKPLTLTKLADLDFGTIIPSGGVGGDYVAIDPTTGARTSATATLINAFPGQRARFASSGVNNSFVFIELPAPPYAPLKNAAGDTMRLEYLKLDGSALRVLTPSSQVFFVGIGGEILVAQNQKEGDYSGTYTLTATYL